MENGKFDKSIFMIDTKYMLSKLKRFQVGFTLIEMLVVIAIISILIGIGVNTFTIAQKKARDTRRKADLHQVQVALEAYATDHGGTYPVQQNPCLSTYGDGTMGLEQSLYVLKSDYMRSIPIDPIHTDCDCSNNQTNGSGGTGDFYGYQYDRVGTGYVLTARMENPGDPQTCGSTTDAAGAIVIITRPSCPAYGGFTGDRLYIIQGGQ